MSQRTSYFEKSIANRQLLLHREHFFGSFSLQRRRDDSRLTFRHEARISSFSVWQRYARYIVAYRRFRGMCCLHLHGGRRFFVTLLLFTFRHVRCWAPAFPFVPLIMCFCLCLLCLAPLAFQLSGFRLIQCRRAWIGFIWVVAGTAGGTGVVDAVINLRVS